MRSPPRTRPRPPAHSPSSRWWWAWWWVAPDSSPASVRVGALALHDAVSRSGSRLRAGTIAVALTLTAGLAMAGPAGAHALRQSSYPDAGATLPKSPTEVRVTFGEKPDPKLSSLRVLDTGGRDRAAGKTEAVAGQPLTLRVAVSPLAHGVYTVSWRPVSRVDGHLASGTFA